MQVLKKIFLICLLWAVHIAPALAQQDSRYSLYMFNGLVLNPAYAGTKDVLSSAFFYRQQWAGVEGAPVTFSLSTHSPVGNARRVGLGLYLENAQIGIHNRVSIFGSYSYKFKVGDGTLSAGLQTGLVYFSSRMTDIVSPEGVPDIVFSEDQYYLKPNFGAGLYYYNKRFYAGVSIPTLLDYNSSDEIKKVTKQYRQYLATAGVVYPIGDMLKLKPSILLKSIPVLSPLQTDANVSILFKDAFWAGVTYRTNEVNFKPESMGFLLGYRFEQGFTFGYSYDMSLTDIRQYGSGSTHEIMLSYDLIKNIATVSPRYF